ncbi:hypothetical protein FKP32DRAFT_1697423, partial [Trametes sanguinea]
AQARHCAKRKAYTRANVMKLQFVFSLSLDQIAAPIPPPLQRIHEVEQENEMLHREVEELRRQLELKHAHWQLRPDGIRSAAVAHDAFSPLYDCREANREPRRRCTSDLSGLYVVRVLLSPATARRA